MNTDHALLREYVQSRSSELFRKLVEQYVNLVFSAALRQVRDRHLAEDVTQAVFLLLSQKAGSIPSNRPLSAWLHRATGYVAANARRADASRRKHENDVTPPNPQPEESEWEELSPMLDAGLSDLKSSDRDAILLRYFEKKSNREIAEAMGVSEESASKRVHRAVDRLRDFFRRHGITVSASAVVLHLSSRATEAAPATLVHAISIGNASASVSLLKGVVLVMAAQKAKVAAVAAAIAVAVSGGVWVMKSFADTSPAQAAPAQGSSAEKGPSEVAKADASQGVITFSNGSVVQIQGIAENTDRPRDWWLVDGTRTDNPRFPGRGNVILDQPELFKMLQIVSTIDGPDQDADLTIALNEEPKRGDVVMGGGMVMTNNQGAAQKVLRTTLTVPTDAATIDLKVGLASGEWKGTVLWSADAGAADVQDAAYVFQSISQDGSQAVVKFSKGKNPPPHSMRIIAQLVDGGNAFPVRMSSNQDEASCTFKVPAADIKTLSLASRDVEYVVLKNVSTAVTDKPTEVQLLESPTTAPAAQEPR